MITLPENWKDGIQLREWLKRVLDHNDAAVLSLILRNTDGSIGFMQSVVLPKDSTDEEKKTALGKAYNGFLVDVPKWAEEQEFVYRYENGKEVKVPITDTTNSEFILSNDLIPYKP